MAKSSTLSQVSKTIRVFVSSTFSDLTAERDSLQRNVFPKLRQLCMENGFRFQAIDLRWGISEEAGLNQRTMHICLEELVRCQRITPRPNFVILLGDRYGWQPLPEEIPAEEFQAIRARMENQQDLNRLEYWYRPDANAGTDVTRALYILRERTGEYVDFEVWSVEVEDKLRSAIRRAVREIDLKPEFRLKYETSATEQEITHGALSVPDAREHVFAYFREITGLPTDKTAGVYSDIGSDGHPLVECQVGAGILKGTLRSALGPNVRDYRADWEGAAPTLNHLPTLDKDVYIDLAGVITRQIEQLTHAEPLAKEIILHEDFGRERAEFFTGRESIIGTIEKYLESPSKHPLVITGASGVGKTALVGYMWGRVRKRHPRKVVIARYVGATPGSVVGRSLLSGLCREISRAYGPDVEPPVEFRELAREFSQRLALATADQPLIILIDALDQLSDEDNARGLAWLPIELPAHVHIAVSMLPCEGQNNLEARLPKGQFAQITQMDPNEGETLLDYWLTDAGRSLRGDQRAEILGKFAKSGLPLYLKLAFEQARHWRSFDGPVPDLGTTVPDLVRNLLARLSAPDEHGEPLVARSLGYLAASKSGLSEDELIDVLSRDAVVMSYVAAHAHHALPLGDRRLPVVLWSRLFFDLERYLRERIADGSSLLSFYHRQVGEVVEEALLSAGTRLDLHEALAAYFDRQPLSEDAGTARTFNLRKLSELPYHQTMASIWTGLESTLCNLDFLQAKAEAGLPYEVIADYDRLEENLLRSMAYNDPHRESRPLFRAFAAAYSQELHAFRDRPRLAAQQIYANLYAKNGFEGLVGACAAELCRVRSLPR